MLQHAARLSLLSMRSLTTVSLATATMVSLGTATIGPGYGYYGGPRVGVGIGPFGFGVVTHRHLATINFGPAGLKTGGFVTSGWLQIFLRSGDVRYWHIADIGLWLHMSAFDPKRTLG